MIKLYDSNKIEQMKNYLSNSNIVIENLNNYIDNMDDYIYISEENNEIDGYAICHLENNILYINDYKFSNANDFSKVLKYIIFNAKNDIVFDGNDSIKQIALSYGFIYDESNNKYYRKYEKMVSNNIQIINYFEQNNIIKDKLLEQLQEPFWIGAKHLYENIISDNQGGKVFMMYDYDQDHIICFGTLHDFDEIESETLKPWIGSIYTFRPYRGNRYSEQLINYILKEAKEDGNEFVYLSSDNEGMYQKYGFELIDMMKTVRGNTTQVFMYDTKKLGNNKRM